MYATSCTPLKVILFLKQSYRPFSLESCVLSPSIAGPNPPSLTVDVVYHDFSQPQISVTLTAVPLWPGYNTQEFNIIVTNSDNGSILESFTVQNDPNVTNSVLNHLRTLLEAVGQQCAVVNVSATAVSYEYGESERVQRTLEVSQSELSYFFIARK